jgi:hypothetical protein
MNKRISYDKKLLPGAFREKFIIHKALGNNHSYPSRPHAAATGGSRLKRRKAPLPSLREATGYIHSALRPLSEDDLENPHHVR